MIVKNQTHYLCSYCDDLGSGEWSYEIYSGALPMKWAWETREVIVKSTKYSTLRKFRGYLKKHYPKQKAPDNVEFLWNLFTAKDEKTQV